MAKILADRDIKNPLGKILIDADPELINPHGRELRLGGDVHFHSTGEEKALKEGRFLRVNPGEPVSIASIETIDFTAQTVQLLFPEQMLMGLITPTTTMMREGISQVTTKIDAGFRGGLNWGLRNGSISQLTLKYGEPIFKLTVFLLSKDEAPELAYGGRPKDSYQDATGIARSIRSLPADIPKSKVVSSGLDKIDPKKQLREAGYPFDHIGTELTALHGKFEVVSSDVLMMKDEFSRRTNELSDKIVSETTSLSGKIEETRDSVLEKVETLFDRRFSVVVGLIIGAIPLIYGGVSYLQGTGLGGDSISFVAMVLGVVIMLGTYFLARRAR